MMYPTVIFVLMVFFWRSLSVRLGFPKVPQRKLNFCGLLVGYCYRLDTFPVIQPACTVMSKHCNCREEAVIQRRRNS